jgi:hypothetical protein
MNEHNNIPTRCSEVVGEALDALTAEVERLKAANAKMREALLIIAGGKEARGNYEEVAWHMAQLASEALAAEGGAK